MNVLGLFCISSKPCIVIVLKQYLIPYTFMLPNSLQLTVRSEVIQICLMIHVSIVWCRDTYLMNFGFRFNKWWSGSDCISHTEALLRLNGMRANITEIVQWYSNTDLQRWGFQLKQQQYSYNYVTRDPGKMQQVHKAHNGLYSACYLLIKEYSRYQTIVSAFMLREMNVTAQLIISNEVADDLFSWFLHTRWL